jgi:hypothetical protein
MNNFVKKVAVAVLSFSFIISSISATLAHNFILTPDNFGVSVGESNGIAATLTHAIGKGMYPIFSLTTEHELYGGYMSYVGINDGPFAISADITSASFKVHYKDGQPTSIHESSFRPYNLDKREIIDSQIADSDYATFSINQAGTAVVVGDIRMTLYGEFKGNNVFQEDKVAYSKTFLNLTNDGMATKRFGGDNVLEVVFAEEVPQGGIKIGDTIKFQVLFKGKPLPMLDEGIHASFIGAETTYDGPGEGWVNEGYLEAETDSNGFVSFTFDHASGWFVGVEYDNEDDSKGYVGGAMFNVASKSGNDGGSGGCDAGLGISFLAGLPVLLASFLRKKLG